MTGPLESVLKELRSTAGAAELVLLRHQNTEGTVVAAEPSASLMEIPAVETALLDDGDDWLYRTDSAGIDRLFPASLRGSVADPVAAAMAQRLSESDCYLLFLWANHEPSPSQLLKLEVAIENTLADCSALRSALLPSEAGADLLAQVLASVSAAIVITDLAAGSSELNPAAGELLGMAAGTHEATLIDSAMASLQARTTNHEEVSERAAAIAAAPQTRVSDWLWTFPDPPTHLRVETSTLELAGRSLRIWVFQDVSEEFRLIADLAESQRIYQLFAENAADAVLLGSADGIVRWASPSISSLVGWPPEEVRGNPFIDLVDPADRAMVREFQRTLPERRSALLEARFLTPDGGSKWLGISVRQTLDEKTGLEIRIGVLRDITAEIAAREELAASERRLQAVIDQVEAVITFQGPNGAPSMSGQTHRILGLPETQVSIEAWRSWVHPDDLPAATAVWDSDASSWELEYRIRRQDGEYIWVLDKSRRVASESGGEPILYGAVMDITAQKQQELRLAELSHELLQAQRLASVGSWSLDLTTEAVEWSPEMFRILGVEPGADLAGILAEFSQIPADQRETMRKLVRRTVATGQPWEFQHEVAWPDNSIHQVFSRGELHLDDLGGRHVRGTSADITKAEEERAAKARRVEARTDYLARVEHTLRTHLSVVEGWAEVLRIDDESVDAADRRLAVEAIARNAGALVAQVNALMDESVQAMRAELLELRPIALAPVIEQVATDYQGINAGVQISLTGERTATALADPAALDTVVRHLVENALRYAHSKIELELANPVASPSPATVTLTVRDDGPGLPAGLAVFDAFATKADGSGHGLGLHVVRTLVEAMQGTVAGGNGRSGGAEFTISLKAVEPGR